eukprot:CAMPEP_0116854428 /NCGR_PEP_ID=MMETSP0418-20121206/18598_1 /TAXON_ID=1158023 /ORGANISM="Astrosyne radiata, Strain 13vi08-1A" /LENGTH=422 /DNA_ID=CAMNT_0004487211 /DNA_START=251 /DNA_END=1519 /DNA_ORIENTATION=-
MSRRSQSARVLVERSENQPRQPLHNNNMKTQKSPHHDCQHYDWQDIRIEKTLGEGCFGSVSECTLLKESRDDNDGAADQPLAIKFVKAAADKKDQNNDQEQAVECLEREIRFLQLLQQHPNVVKVHGVSKPKQQKPFVVMERLEETLVERLTKWWKQQQQPCHNSWLLWNERISVALGIASALGYMYKQHEIVHRDIKPGNIGLDRNGHVKLLDFGLAKKLHDPLDTYTPGQDAIVGTFPYMAPEVAQGKLGDGREGDFFKMDVYSFGILFWEMCALKGTAFSYLTRLEWMKQVIKGNVRPDCDDVVFSDPLLSFLIKPFLESCWHADPLQRPDWDRVIATLKEIQEYVQEAWKQELLQQEENNPTKNVLSSKAQPSGPNREQRQISKTASSVNRSKSFHLRRHGRRRDSVQPLCVIGGVMC